MPCLACRFQTIVNCRKRSRQFAKALSGRSQTWTARHHLVGRRAHKIEGRRGREQWWKDSIGRQAKQPARRGKLRLAVSTIARRTRWEERGEGKKRVETE